MATEIKQVTCPTCKKKAAWTIDNAFRPFCSNQCQLIDFGDWASERNSIPAVASKDEFSYENSLDGGMLNISTDNANDGGFDGGI